jgi:uncharacterized protein (TIGR03435 family)
MKRVCACLSLTALLSTAAFGQAVESAPKFEVADVHSSPHITQPLMQGPFFAGSRYELRFASMLDLIRVAYDLDPERIHGGPSWLEMDRFDVLAKMPPSAAPAARRQMLQSLLAERFKLVTHNDSKPMSAWALIAGKHAGLKQSDGEGESGCSFAVQNAPTGPPTGGAPLTLPTIQYTCKNKTMAAFATEMLNLAGAAQYFNNRPVVDKTELAGAWDFVFRFTPKIPAGIQTTGEAIPLFDAIDKQLGLKLEPANVPMPVVVVDSAERKPTENSAEAMKSFPPLPTEFEVVDLKPVDPGANRGPQQPTIKNGRVYLPGFPLKVLIQVAWDLNGDDLIVGAQKWMDEDRFDLLAKAPAGVPIGDLNPQRSGISINLEALRPMIRSMIVDRFKLVSHIEERPVSSYTLVASKPKLKKSDPASRTRWHEGVDPDSKPGKNANAALGRLVTCENVSMAQFADMLPGIAPGYLHTKVVDGTGLEGGWDFTFSFSPAGLLQQNAAPRPEGSEVSEATTVAISLFDAITKQLGLKLEQQKRPTPVLVIESISRKPTEN